jgi:N6-L-threonylcarbamoyladenine synthase
MCDNAHHFVPHTACVPLHAPPALPTLLSTTTTTVPPPPPGEAYDKVARMLGLELVPNGGAALEVCAAGGNPHAYQFAVPMQKHANCDFSYAGLKTSTRLAIERELGSAEGAGKRASADAAASAGAGGSSISSSGSVAQRQEQQPAQTPSGVSDGISDKAVSQGADADSDSARVRADIAASFQRVAVAHLVARLRRGMEWAREECPDLRHLVIAGGVASNAYLRSEVAQVRVPLAVCLRSLSALIDLSCASV